MGAPARDGETGCGETPARRWWRPALLVLLLLTLAGVVLVIGVPTIEELRTWVARAGWTGPVLFAAVYAGLSLTPAAPASVLNMGAGVLFGFGVGLPVSLAGAVTGAVIGFALARRLGRGAVARLRTRSGPVAVRFTALDEALGRSGVRAAVGVRLVPLLPFSVLNAGCGLSSMRLRDFALGSAVGLVPGVTAMVTIGAFGAEPGSPPFLLAVGGHLALVGGAVALRRRLGLAQTTVAPTGHAGRGHNALCTRRDSNP